MAAGRRVLLVEDDDDLRFIALTRLGELQLDITVAYSGNEAIKLLENGLSVDLVISDYSMPDGDGVTLLEYVAKRNTTLPFVFYSSHPKLDIPVQYKNFLGAVYKFDFDHLKTIINETLFK